jgi:Flp pilus assembly protein TadG
MSNEAVNPNQEFRSESTGDSTPRRWLRPRRRRGRQSGETGQAIVEFAIVSVVLLLTVFGTVDFGRAIYLQAQLENGVKEAARDLKTRSASGLAANNCGAITQSAAQFRVRNARNPESGGGCNQGEHARPGLQTATATISCSPSCTSGSQLTVNGTLAFQAITQQFLGISPITLTASATVVLE